jgi:hypothetical protein
MAIPGAGKFGIRTLNGIWWDGRGFSSYSVGNAELYETFASAEADCGRAYGNRPEYMLEIVQVRVGL